MFPSGAAEDQKQAHHKSNRSPNKWPRRSASVTHIWPRKNTSYRRFSSRFESRSWTRSRLEFGPWEHFMSAGRIFSKTSYFWGHVGATAVMVINSSTGSDHTAPSPSCPVFALFNINTCNLTLKTLQKQGNWAEGYSNIRVHTETSYSAVERQNRSSVWLLEGRDESSVWTTNWPLRDPLILQTRPSGRVEPTLQPLSRSLLQKTRFLAKVKKDPKIWDVQKREEQ